jgi:hypothetical protein
MLFLRSPAAFDNKDAKDFGTGTTPRFVHKRNENKKEIM